MKKLFISELDTPLGRQICDKFGKLNEYDIIGTARHPEKTVDENGDLPPYVKSICPSYRDDNVEFKAQVLEADVIVCPLRDDVAEAGAAIRMLGNTAYDTEKTFVLVSSVLTWGNTYNAQKAEEEAEKAAERQAMIDAGEELPEEEEPEEPEEAPTFTDDLYQKRVTHRRYQHWRDLEVMTKQANSDTLHTYVVFAGMTYGGGEDFMHPMFRAAWHNTPLPLYTPGNNVVPMIHISDLANIAMKLGNSNDTLTQRYFLGVDRGNHTLSQIVKAINDQMGNGETYPVPESQHGAVQFIDNFTIDLKFEPANVFEVHEEDQWAAPEGFVAAIEKVCDEYRAERAVPPVRSIVVGPPHSGKSTISKKVAEHYRINHLHIADIIEDYKEYVADLEQQLKDIRAAKKAEKRRLEKEEKKRAAKEAAEAAAAEAADADEVKKAPGGDDDDEDEDGDASGVQAPVEVDSKDGENAVDLMEDISFEVTTPPPEPVDGENAGEDGDAESKPNESEEKEEPEDDAEAEEDDEEDELLAKLKDDIALGQKILKLQIQVGGPKKKAEDEEDVEEGEEEDPDANEANAEDADAAPAKFRYIDEALASMVRWKLQQKKCRNQGYVLDGFPKTVRQASLTFIAGDIPLPELEEDGTVPMPEEEEDATQLLNPVEDKLLPDVAFVLESNEALLQSRVNEAEEETATTVAGHRSLANFYKRLKEYKAGNAAGGKPHQSVVAWLQAILTNKETLPRDMTVEPIDATKPVEDGGLDDMLADVQRVVGEPRYYKPTPEMIIDAARQEALLEEQAALKAIREQEEAEKAAAEAAEVKRRAAANHQRRYTSIEEEQEAAREMRDLPMQQYLMRYVIPAVTRSMQQTVALRPEDPVDALGDLLFNYQSKTQL